MRFSDLQTLIKLGRDFGHAQIRDAGFSDTEHAICTFLCFHDGVSQNAIANALMLDKTTVAKALSALEEKEMIRREQDGQNRRKNIVRITPAGKASVSDSLHIYDTWFSEVCSCLDSDELRQLDDAIGKLTRCALDLRDNARQAYKDQ